MSEVMSGCVRREARGAELEARGVGRGAWAQKEERRKRGERGEMRRDEEREGRRPAIALPARDIFVWNGPSGAWAMVRV